MQTLAISSALAALAFASPLVAQDCLQLDQRVEITDGNNLAHLAFSRFVALSADGNRAFASSKNDFGFTGAVYVFRRDHDGWVQEQKLFSPDPHLDEDFGGGLACDAAGRRLVVLEGGDNGQLGALHVYLRDGTSWSLEATLDLPGTALVSELDLPLAMNSSGDVLLVGYWPENDYGGAALVYRRQGSSWGFERRLVPAPVDAGPLTYFGWEVDLDASGDLAFVSSPGSGVAGFVYVFGHDPSGWRRLARLAASDGTPSNSFGAVAASATGDTLAIGANGDDPDGSVYVFERAGGTWIEQAKLLPGPVGTQFGIRVDIDATGGTIVASAHTGGDSVEDAAYVFRRAGSVWHREQLPAGTDHQELGKDVALGAWGEHAFVGATAQNVSQHGTAYAFRCDRPLAFCPGVACACGPAGLPDRGCDTTALTRGVRLDDGGFAPDGLGGGTLDLVATGFNAGATPVGIALRSAQLDRDGVPFGRGVLCLTGAIARVGATQAQAGTAALSLAHGAGAGTFAYQLWFRDGAPNACAPGAANLSNALEVTWP